MSRRNTMEYFWKVCSLVLIQLVLLCISLCSALNFSHGLPEQDMTFTTAPSASSIVAKDTMTGCTLTPVSPGVKNDIVFLIENDAKLIKITLTILNDDRRFNGSGEDQHYRLYKWKMANGYSGKSLLILKDSFEAMSAWALGYGVETANVELRQEPKNCLANATKEDIETYIRGLLLSNFDDNAVSGFPQDVEVCNRRFQEPTRAGKGVAGIVCTCCRRNDDARVECNDLEVNFWLGFMSQQILLLQVLFVLLSPLLIPESMYMLKSRFLKYIYEPPSEQPMKLKVKTIQAGHTPNNTFQITRRHWFANLTKLKEALRREKHGVVQEFNVNAIELEVRANKILPANFAPVGLFDFIYKFFVRCNLRNEVHEDIGGCCNEDMCRLLPCKSKIYWYRCLMYFMGAILGAICTIPWLFRVWFYYEYEQANINALEVLAERNVTLAYTRSLVTFLSPTHTLFMAIYLLLPLELVLFISLPPSFKRKLKFTARQCFRDMRETPKLDACAFFIAYLFWPLKHFGIVGCLIWPLWLCLLPLSMFLLVIQVFPIVNVSVRMFINILYYILKTIYPGSSCTTLSMGPFHRARVWLSRSTHNVIIVDTQERNNRGNTFVHACGLIMSFITLCMILILLIECVSFYVECAVYIVIGVILNANKLMKHVSLLLLITWYGYDCFNGVLIRYVSFNELMNTKVRKLVGDPCREVALRSQEEQTSTAFAVESMHGRRDKRMSLVAGSEGYLKWRASRLLLFLDESDIPRIPKQFMFTMAKLPHASCPGHLHLQYLKAAVEFGMIILFLMFVFVVIVAFGRATDVSSANQTLATLAGGFLPFVFRKFLFKSHDGTCLDESNLKWQGMSSAAIENFTARWNFSDISVTPCKLDKTTATDDQLDNSSLNLSTYTSVDIETERDIMEQISDVANMTSPYRDITQPLLSVTPQQDGPPVDLIVRFRYTNNSRDEIVDCFVPKQHTVKGTTQAKLEHVNETVL